MDGTIGFDSDAGRSLSAGVLTAVTFDSMGGSIEEIISGEVEGSAGRFEPGMDSSLFGTARDERGRRTFARSMTGARETLVPAERLRTGLSGVGILGSGASAWDEVSVCKASSGGDVSVLRLLFLSDVPEGRPLGLPDFAVRVRALRVVAALVLEILFEIGLGLRAFPSASFLCTAFRIVRRFI